MNYDIKTESITEEAATSQVPIKQKLKSKKNSNHVSNLNIEKKNSKVNAKNNQITNKGSYRVSQLQAFLNQFKIERGQEYTHTSMGSPGGSYFIPIEHKKELI